MSSDLKFKEGDLVVWDLEQSTEESMGRTKFKVKHYGTGPFEVVAVRKTKGILALAADQVVDILTPGGKTFVLSRELKLYRGDSGRMKRRAWKGFRLVKYC